MPSFRRIASAPVTPTSCVFCGTFEGPFVESVPEREIPGYGRVYVCAANEPGRAGCLVQAAREVGCFGKEETDRLFDDLAKAGDRIRDLETEVSRRKDPVVLSGDEYERLLDRAGVQG